MNSREKWLDWAVELQSIAQGALYYCKDKFDIERFERIREISAEMLSLQTEIPLDKVKDIFCDEKGYQTPKLDTRAAIFKDDKILLVQEANGTWSLPGGWVDVGLSVKENIVKEVKEEAGLDVTAEMVIAVQDREKHNQPLYVYRVCKIFLLCKVTGGQFEENLETVDSRYFEIDELPVLAEEKNIKLEAFTSDISAVCDAKWTEEAVCNLLDNAVKYTPDGGNITVRMSEYEMFCCIDVTDDGNGISEEEQPKIFGRFYRGKDVYNKQGVGIGLYLTRQIVSNEGGYMKVISSEENGSTFSIFLQKA